MKPVDQTTFGHGKGNCFSACVASVLERRLEDVPYFMSRGDAWFEYLVEWCAEQHIGVEFSTEFPAPPDRHVIIGGVSPRSGKGHACVALNGEIVHDPHPDRTGLTGAWWDWILLTVPS